MRARGAHFLWYQVGLFGIYRYSANVTLLGPPPPSHLRHIDNWKFLFLSPHISAKSCYLLRSLPTLSLSTSHSIENVRPWEGDNFGPRCVLLLVWKYWPMMLALPRKTYPRPRPPHILCLEHRSTVVFLPSHIVEFNHHHYLCDNPGCYLGCKTTN